MSSKRSRVHPTYKTKYSVTNWPEYDRGLVDRGDLTFWISQDAIDAWHPAPPRRTAAVLGHGHPDRAHAAAAPPPPTAPDRGLPALAS
jgi:hypothetical protein